MNQTDNLDHAPDLADASRAMIGAHIGSEILDRMVKLLPSAYPPDSQLVVFMLRRLLTNALENAGLRSTVVSVVGPLSDCAIYAQVTDARIAVAVFKTELAAVSLLSFAKIGVLGKDGWLCCYPSAEVRMEWLMDLERQELHEARRAQTYLDFMQKIADAIRLELAQPNLSPAVSESLTESLRAFEAMGEELNPPDTEAQ